MDRVYDSICETEIGCRSSLRYRLQLFHNAGQKGPIVVVVTHLWGDPGRPSVVNNVERMATDIWQEVAKPKIGSRYPCKGNVDWIIQVPPNIPDDWAPGGFRDPEWFTRFELRWEGDRAPLQTPIWMKIDRREVERLIGEVLEPGIAGVACCMRNMVG